MIEPARLHQLRLPGDTFEAKTEPLNHTQAWKIVGGGGAADAMHGHARKRELYRSVGGLGHQPLAGGVTPQPIAELAGAMQVHTRVEPDDAEQLARMTVTDREAHGSP